MSNSLVGNNIKADNADWSFGGDVYKSFDEHVNKSVPFYQEGHELIAQLSDFFLHDNSQCYDLGCSTGVLLRSIKDRHPEKTLNLTGIDLEENMINEAKSRVDENENITYLCDDFLNIQFEKSDLIIAYYTLQFVQPQNRQIIFDRIYDALNWGGALILFEKVRGPDARFQDISTSLYMDYKLSQGFNSEEIVNKSRSLKGVLEPFSTQGNMDLLERAGFEDKMTIMKYICFEGIVAIK